jgi:hypothetical protein
MKLKATLTPEMVGDGLFYKWKAVLTITGITETLELESEKPFLSAAAAEEDFQEQAAALKRLVKQTYKAELTVKRKV